MCEEEVDKLVRELTPKYGSWLAKNPALAVNAAGTLGFLYQAFPGTTWDTQLELTTDGWATAVTPMVLHTAPSNVEDGRGTVPLTGSTGTTSRPLWRAFSMAMFETSAPT